MNSPKALSARRRLISATDAVVSEVERAEWVNRRYLSLQGRGGDS